MTRKLRPQDAIDRCPWCKATVADAPSADVIFYTAPDGTFCQVCGEEVTFTRTGRAIQVRKVRS